MPHATPDPFIRRLALRLLERAERTTGDGPVRLALDRRAAPELFDCHDQDELDRWRLLIEAWCEGGAVRLKLGPAREFAGFTDRRPQIELLDFDGLAAAVGHVRRDERWERRLLDHLRGRWAVAAPVGVDVLALLDYLARNPLAGLSGLVPEEAAASLEALHALCVARRSMPLREASARAFQGRSKLLDSRDELLRLLGATPGQFHEGPIQLLVDLPVDFDAVLFVENLVTFERMADWRAGSWQRSALVYAAGFRGGARRLRSRAACRLYLRTGADCATAAPARQAGLLRLEDWLFGAQALPVSFFGDLDFAGMAILRSLRETLGAVNAWQPGYAPLATELVAGGGHLPAQAAKEQQTDPGTTGCDYADRELLELLRRTGRFVDQEWFAPDRPDWT